MDGSRVSAGPPVHHQVRRVGLRSGGVGTGNSGQLPVPRGTAGPPVRPLVRRIPDAATSHLPSTNVSIYFNTVQQSTVY